MIRGSRHDHVAPRLLEISCPVKDRIREHAAHGIADHACEKYARGEDCGLLMSIS